MAFILRGFLKIRDNVLKLYISTEPDKKIFYENKDEVIKEICDYIRIKRCDFNEVEVYTNELLTEEVVEAITKCDVEKITIFDESKIDEEIVNKLKQKKLVFGYELQKDDKMYFNDEYFSYTQYPLSFDMHDKNINLDVTKDLTKEELEILGKMFNMYKKEQVCILFNNTNQFKEILDLINTEELVLRITSNLDFSYISYVKEKFKNVKFEINARTFKEKNEPISYEKLLLKELILNSIIEEVKSLNLTPFEEYMYLYNITKNFKHYKESDDNYLNSRVIDMILFNDDIVCEGYSNLLEELVKRLNNPNVRSVRYALDAKENEDANFCLHARNLTYINDTKYDINNIFISDPTWDCISFLKSTIFKKSLANVDKAFSNINDWYLHFMMTDKEIENEAEVKVNDEIKDLVFKGEISERYNKWNKDALARFGLDINFIKSMALKNVPVDKIYLAIGVIYSKVYLKNVPALIDKVKSDNDTVRDAIYNVSDGSRVRKKV